MATTELHCSGVMGIPHVFLAKTESIVDEVSKKIISLTSKITKTVLRISEISKNIDRVSGITKSINLISRIDI